MTSRTGALTALCLTAALTLAGCGSSSSGGTNASQTQPTASTVNTPTNSPPASSPAPAGTAPANPAAATKQVKKAYAIVFNSGSNIKKAETGLEDGPSLGATLRYALKVAKGQKEGANVKKVTFTSPTAATVLYALTVNGKVALPNATGQAVQQNGKWKLAKGTLCGLLALAAKQGTKVPGCTT